jgi:tellurite methyltransferase
MPDGGYDEGYAVCPCFWGTEPAEMVRQAIAMHGASTSRRAIDLGCGDGKNAAALSDAGFSVIAIDKSEVAVRNAIASFGDRGVQWLVTDLTAVQGPAQHFDLVIATGSLHCLPTAGDVTAAVALMQQLTVVGGLNVLYAFDDGPHNMDGHDPSFKPTLLRHAEYLAFYEHWDLIRASSEVQTDKHPHNDVPHSHSITRVLARRLR